MSHQQVYAQRMRAFQGMLDDLRNHPDLNLISSMARLASDASHDIEMCQDLAFVCIAKLTNPSTPPSFKRPVFYAIDAILKCGGPFPSIFSRVFFEQTSAFRDMPVAERSKMDALINIWVERSWFSPQLAERMRAELFARPKPQTQQTNFDSNDATIQFAIHNEMIAILNELYSTMDVANPLTLDEIQRTNPQLFNQIRQEAEVKAREMLSSRSSLGSTSALPQHSMKNVSGGKRPLGAAFPASNAPDARSRSEPPFRPHANGRDIAERDLRGSMPRPAHRAEALQAPSSGTFVNGYVWEQPVLIDVERARELTSSMEKRAAVMSGPADVTPAAWGHLRTLLPRVHSYLADVMTPPPLPRFLNDALPAEPLFREGAQSHISAGGKTAVVCQDRSSLPQFKIEDLLNSRPDAMIKALYEERPHQFHEDGLRFKTREQYAQHADKFFKSADFLKRNKTASRQSRQMYCTIEQWVTDFFSFSSEQQSSSAAASSSSAAKDTQQTVSEEYVVPADDDFQRCPISGELFEKFKDNDGEELYRNAVKVLVIPNSGDIFSKSLPIPHMVHCADKVRYMVVHKRLVMDQWLQAGQSETLEDVLKHPHTLELDVDLLKEAAGEEQDDDEIFVKLS